jgi:hypothetical protein
MTTLDLVNGFEGAKSGGAMYIMKSYVDTINILYIYISGMEPADRTSWTNEPEP